MGLVDKTKSAASNTANKMKAGAKGNASAAGNYDGMAGALFGGQLQKAKLAAYDKPAGCPMSAFDIDFFLNPTTVSITKSVELEEVKTTGTTTESRWTATNPLQLKLGELWFDTYESRESVRSKYIDKVEKLLEYHPAKHHPLCVRLVWGKFTEGADQDKDYYFWIKSLTVDYTMFLPNGTPVRAKVALELTQQLPVKKQQSEKPKHSPDHAKLYTVTRGDTLQSIANTQLEDPREWRRIADVNGIDDPMGLRPGTKLLVPPIIK